MLDIHKEKLSSIAEDQLLLDSLKAIFDQLIDYERKVRSSANLSNENLGAFMRAYHERILIRDEFLKAIEATRKVEAKQPERNRAR